MNRLLQLLSVILCVMLIVPIAFSQTNSTIARARVDTEFVVGDNQLPAGDYIFTIDSSTNRMRITNTDTRKTAVVFVQERVENSTPVDNKLVFQNDGGQSVLHKVWSSRMGHVYDILHGTDVTELE